MLTHPKLDTNNPYNVMSFIRNGIRKARADSGAVAQFPEMRARAEKAIASMERSYGSVRQLCDLHLSQEYRKAYNRISWWKIGERRDFRKNKDLWLKEKHDTLKKEADEIDWNEP